MALLANSKEPISIDHSCIKMGVEANHLDRDSVRDGEGVQVETDLYNFSLMG